MSLSMGLAPVGLATCIGGMLGITAGYYGRHVNMAIMRTIDVFARSRLCCLPSRWRVSSARGF